LRSGRASREEKLAVCTGGVNLPPPDLAELLTLLALDSDELISTRAQESILALPIENFVEALNRQQALEPLFEFAAKNLAAKPGVADALIKNKNCPAEHLVPLVQHLSALGTGPGAGKIQFRYAGTEEPADRIAERRDTGCRRIGKGPRGSRTR